MALSALPTEEELHKIRECILLSLLIEVVNKNGCQLQYDHNVLKSLFLTATDVLLDRIIFDHDSLLSEINSNIAIS